MSIHVDMITTMNEDGRLHSFPILRCSEFASTPRKVPELIPRAVTKLLLRGHRQLKVGYERDYEFHIDFDLEF